jgi:ADP-ribose pyrophosphatase
MADIQPEETIKSETVYHGKLIDLRKDTVRLPNGKEAIREVVVHPEVVAMVPVLPDGRLVLVRQYREAVRRTLLEVPAGGIDGGETPEEAARREMIEETGYRVGSLTHMCSFYSSPGFTTELMHVYLCEGLQAGKPTEENDEIEVLSLTPDEAIEAVQGGQVMDAKSVAALTLYQLRRS